jgi:hypothetical protein
MRKLIVITALVAFSSTAVAREEQKVFKWTDEQGQVHYGDSIPAEYADRPKERLNDQGVAVEEIAGKKTDEQRAEESRLEKIRVAQELQQRADQALLNTYLSVEEIIMHRDRRVELYQAQSKVTELYLRNLGRRLESIRTEAERYLPYSQDPNAPMIPDELAEDLRDTKDTIARHENNLKKYERNERQIIERFDKDISRFRILKGIDEPQAAVEERTALVTP